MTIEATTATNPVPIPTVSGTYWQWRGESVYYLRAGRGDRPPLLLVHGFGASTDHWRKNVSELQQDFEVWAIDLLGFGRSSKPAWTYSGQLWQEQLQEFIASVIGRPAVLVGNSLGGYAALSVAANHPEWAAGVILLNSAGPFSERPETAKPQPRNPLQALLGRALRGLFLQPWASYLLFQWLRQPWVIRRTLAKVYVDRSAITEQLVEDIYWPSCDVGAARVFASVFKSPRGATVDELLVRLQRPLFLLWGEGDPWMQARARSQKFRQYYPQLKEVFLQAGHCPHDEAPAQVNAQIRAWMRSEISNPPA